MEGFLNLRIRPWLRRLITRSLAIVPAAVTIYFLGERGSYQLLILSQVILSLQLPFAVVPLVQFTGDRRRMGEFVSPLWVRLLAWLTTIIIIALNVRLVTTEISKWFESAGAYRPWLVLGLVPLIAGLTLLLLWMAFEPLLPDYMRKFGRGRVELPQRTETDWRVPQYRRILLPLDHSSTDSTAIAHAAALAKGHGAVLDVLHIEEGVTSQVYGAISSTAEVESGREYLAGIVSQLCEQGIPAQLHIYHAKNPRQEIVRVAKELSPDLIVMGGHGHKGLKDIFLGTTINAVRHEVGIPILVVRA